MTATQIASRLRLGGADDKLADAIAQVQMDLLEANLASKADLAGIKTELALTRGDLKVQMTDLRGDMRELRADVRGDMRDLLGNVKDFKTHIDGRMDTIRTILLAAAVPIVAACVKYLLA